MASGSNYSRVAAGYCMRFVCDISQHLLELRPRNGFEGYIISFSLAVLLAGLLQQSWVNFLDILRALSS